MQHSAQTDDLRESYRCAVDESKRAAELRAGGDWIPVELLDESAGGFGVRVDRPLSVSTGDLVQLRLAAECFEARVMNVVEQSPSGDEEEPAFRLCLKRAGEIFLEAEEKRPWFERFKRPRRHTPFGSAGTLFCAAIIFVVLAVVTPAVIIYLFGSRNISDSLRGSHAGAKSDEVLQQRGSSNEPSAARPAGWPFGFFADAPKHNAFGTEPSTALHEKRDTSFSLLLDHAMLQSNLGKWSDAVLAVIADLAEKLSVTKPQQEEIGGILQDADEEIARLNVPDPDNTPQKVATKRASILETAYEKLVQVFTDTQRMQWDELVKKWSGEIKAPADPRKPAAAPDPTEY